MTTSRPIVLAFPLALALAACGHGGPSVRQEDFARVSAAASPGVESASGDVAAAQDELAAARARGSEVRRESDAADSERRRAEDARARARRAAEVAEARERAASAHREYAEKLAAAREASEQGAARRLELAKARLELAKLEAVQQAGVTVTEKYDKAAFLEQVTDAQKRSDEAQAKARQLAQDAEEAHRRWEERARAIPEGE